MTVDVISTNGSLAAATNCRATPIPERDAAKAAEAQMRPVEHDSWKAYLKGSIQLPDMNWEESQDRTPIVKNSLRTAGRRAEALNRLYGTNRARPSHSVWFTRNHMELLPLVKVMARVINMERGLTGGHCHANESTITDLQTIRSFISSSSRIHREHETLSKSHKNVVNSKLQVLIDHQRKLQRVVMGSRKRKAVPFPLTASPTSKRISGCELRQPMTGSNPSTLIPLSPHSHHRSG